MVLWICEICWGPETRQEAQWQRYLVDPVGNNCNCIVPLLENPGFGLVVAAGAVTSPREVQRSLCPTALLCNWTIYFSEGVTILQ